jgi:peptide/nickel transport system ATP-binding protein
MTGPLVSIEDLHVSFLTEQGSVRAVDGVSFDLEPGKSIGIVGESGSGKSVTAKTLMNLLPSYAEVKGSMKFDGRDLSEIARKKEKHFWGLEKSWSFQHPKNVFLSF